MEYIAQAKDYWIAPQAVKITLNALGNPHRTQVTVASGAVIMCYIKGVDGLEYDNGHQYRAWAISASPTYFNTATKKYVYAAIPRSSEVGVQAFIVYPSEMLDIYGCNEDGDQIGSENFYYIWLQGVISESAYNRANRYWLTDIDYGILSTDEARDDQSYNTDWYTFNAVTQTVTFLKEIIMKAGSSFRNLILGGHNLTGVATAATPEDIDSDTLVVTPNYIRNKFLHKDRDDTTPYSLTIEQELRVGNRGIMNHLQSTDYTGDGMLDSGYKLWYEEGRAKLVIDDLVARGKFTVNEIETRIWTYAGGNMVFSGAGSTIFYVEYLDANDNALGYTYINQPWLLRGRALLAASLSWSKRRQIQRQLTDIERAAVVKFRCYEFSDDGTMQTRNWWQPNDIAMCQTLNKVREKQNSDGSYSGSASNTVYKRRIAGIGSKEIPMLNDGRVYDYVDLWNIYDLAGNSCKYMGTDGQEHLITDSVKGFQNMAPSGATPSTDWPAAGDVIVQMGNPLDTDRQAAVTIEVQGDVHGFKVYDTISDYSMENDLWVEIGYDQTSGKAKANVYGDFRFGCRESEEAQGGSYVKYNRTTKQLDIRANVRFTSPTTHQETTLDNFASAVVGDLSNLQSQIDGQIESWFYNYSPVHVDSEGVPDSKVPLNVAPYSDWTTDALKIAHLGDTFTNNETGYCWRFSRNATTNAFEWVIIEDSAVIKALQDAARAQYTADHKRRVFTAQPTAPYDAGDLWVNVTYPANYTGETDESQHKYKNEILKCITSKPLDTDTFSINDWSLSNGYTSKLNNFVTNTYAPFAQSIQTQVDKKAETYRQATNPASSWAEADKPNHVGDIWMDTANGKNTYIYQNTTAAGQTPVYDWVAQDVPDDVFDAIDGKAEIFVSKPTNYCERDLWIIGNDLSSTEMPIGCKVGDIVVADNMPSGTTKRTNSYVKDDWRKKDRYTDDTKVNTFIGELLDGNSDTELLMTAAFKAIRAAINKGVTTLSGGLILSNEIELRDTAATPKVWAGISGMYDSSVLGSGIAAWYGGSRLDYFTLSDAQKADGWDGSTYHLRYAKSLFRMDGTGYLAGGKIKWDSNGDGYVANGNVAWTTTNGVTTVTINGATVQNAPSVNTQQLLLNGVDITSTLNTLMSMFEIDSNGDIRTKDYTVNGVTKHRGFWSPSFISALGQGSGGGGGGGQGDVTWALLADNTDTRQIAISHLTGDSSYSGVLSVLTGYTTSGKNYAIQKDASNHLFVNVPWTDTTYTLAGLMGSSAKGSTTQPIYWNGSAFANTSYTLGKSVPADAVFTDTNTWRNIYTGGTSRVGTGTNTKAMNFVAGSGISVGYAAAGTGTGQSGSDNYFNIGITNTGVRSATINGNYLRVNTNGTNADLTIPYATNAGTALVGNKLNVLATISGQNTANYPWRLIAQRAEITTNYEDIEAVIVLRQFSNGGRTGILKIAFRTNEIATTASSASAVWMVRYGFAADDVKVALYWESGKSYADIYLKATAWNRMEMHVIGNRSWSFVSSSEGTDGSSPTNAYASIEAAATALHGRAYTNIVSAQDGGIVSYANTAGAADTANSAAKLTTVSKTAWGQTFWTANGVPDSISGNMSSVGDISFSASGKKIGGFVWFDTTNNRLGIGTNSPSYPLHVAGQGYFGGNINCPYVLNGISSIEFRSFENTSGIGGWIDFHFNGSSTSDYSSRIAEYASGVVTLEGSFVATGAVTALSDARDKNVIDDVHLTVEQIAKMPAVVFKWKDSKHHDNLLHIGTLAQNWLPVLPQTVLPTHDGKLSFDYASAALVGVITTAKKVVDHEKRIVLLETRIKALEKELDKYKN